MNENNQKLQYLLREEKFGWVKQDLLPLFALLDFGEEDGNGFFTIPLSKENIIHNLKRITRRSIPIIEQELEEFEQEFSEYIEIKKGTYEYSTGNTTQIHPPRTRCSNPDTSTTYYNLKPELVKVSRNRLENLVSEPPRIFNEMISTVCTIKDLIYIGILKYIMEKCSLQDYYPFESNTENDLKEILEIAEIDRELIEYLLRDRVFQLNCDEIVKYLPTDARHFVIFYSHSFNTSSCYLITNFYVRKELAQYLYEKFKEIPIAEHVKITYKGIKQQIISKEDRLPLFDYKDYRFKFLNKYHPKIVNKYENLYKFEIEQEDLEALKFLEESEIIKIEDDEIILASKEKYNSLFDSLSEKENRRIDKNKRELLSGWLRASIDLQYEEQSSIPFTSKIEPKIHPPTKDEMGRDVKREDKVELIVSPLPYIVYDPSIEISGTASHPKGIESVTVNGEQAGAGSWSKTILLKEMENTITIIAKSKTGEVTGQNPVIQYIKPSLLSDFITFPTASDEHKTSKVLGRGQFFEKFILGMDEEKKYITIPWNGKESHISMFCGTGTGKSTLVSSIALQSIFQRTPVVIFDPKDGWGISLIKPLNDILNQLDDQKKKSIHERFKLTNQSLNGFDFSKPIRFDLDGKDYEIKYNLFSFDENVLQKIKGAKEYRTPLLNIPNVYPFPEKTEKENIDRFRDACDMVATSFVGALNLKGDAAYNSEISSILQDYEGKKSFFTREDFIEILSKHDPKKINKKNMEKLEQGVERYCTANAKFIARDEKSVIPTDEIFNNPFIEENKIITISIFDIQSIGAMAEQDKTKIMTMYSSSVTGQIFDYINKKNPPKGVGYKIGMPKVWLIYDEAHNLIEEGKSTSNNNIKRIMQEGRSLGAFAIIISQKPQNVDITARAQAKNRIYSEVTWDSISRDLNVSDDIKEKIRDKVSKSKKSTKMMTLVNDENPDGKLIYPLTSPQCILAKTDIINLL